MKKTYKLLLGIFTLCMLTISGTSVLADYDVRPEKIVQIISSNDNITVGTSFELKAIASPKNADDDNFYWSIVGKKGIVKFEDYDRNDDEIELKAIKKGTTKVRCSILDKAKKYSKTFKIKVKKAPQQTSKIIKKSITVEQGDDFDLEVKNKGFSRKNLKWNIKNTMIVDFENDYDDDYDDYYDDDNEIELFAKQTGKTVVTCKDKKSNQTIKFTVTVVPDNDRDYDDD